MLFSSFEFIVFFFPIVLTVFAACSKLRSFSNAKLLLILASAVFYMWWSFRDAALLAFLVVANYLFSLAIIRWREAGRLRGSRAFAALGVAFNVAVLVIFKYSNLLVTTALGVIGAKAPHFDITLPLGISFFTFQKIAFLVDSYKTDLKRQSFANFALFVSFFPQLIAGPIVHHREMMPQFDRRQWQHRPSLHVSIGLTLFTIGLAKKVLLADNLSPFVGPVFAAADQGIMISGIEAWGAMLAYGLQLYFDFSGYSDMALGLARCFGIILPANFYSPYRATSIIDFWRRWHMTLSRFLRDYVYIPLGGNRHGKGRRYANLFATMTIGGLWHGANWTFLVWGALHGIALGMNHLFRELILQRSSLRVPRALSWLMTLLFVMLAWLPFRAATFHGATVMLAGVAGIEGFLPVRLLDQLGPLESALIALRSDASLVLSMRDWALSGAPMVIIAGLIAIFGPNSVQLLSRYRPALESRALPLGKHHLSWRPTPMWAALVVLLMILSVLRLSDVNEFLYFQF